MPIQAVIFDLGGVLVRTEDRTPRTSLAERLGLTYIELGELVFDSQSSHQAMRGEITTEEHWDTVRKKLGLSKEEYPRVPLEFWGGDKLDEDLVNYLRGLRPQYKTALLSNAWDDLRQMIEEVWDFADAFDQIVISAEVGMVKPEPPIYEMVVADLDVKPGEAVFVDDFPENVAGAKAVGLEAIQFISPQQTLQDLEKLLNSK
jgi:epoxide hydrolase-like predicted phosphatase